MSLDTWRDIADATTRQIALVGDSTTERGWGRVLRDIAEPRWGYGGLGFRHMGKNGPSAVPEWVQVGTWTKGGSTDAWNIAPCTGGVNTNNGTWHASGSANTF